MRGLSPCIDLREDCLHGDFRRSDDELIADPNNAKTLLRQPIVSRLIGRLAIDAIMRRAVDLDDDPFLETNEVGNEVSDRYLAAKLSGPPIAARARLARELLRHGPFQIVAHVQAAA